MMDSEPNQTIFTEEVHAKADGDSVTLNIITSDRKSVRIHFDQIMLADIISDARNIIHVADAKIESICWNPEKLRVEINSARPNPLGSDFRRTVRPG